MPTPLLSGRPGVVCLNYKEYRTGRNTLRLRQIVKERIEDGANEKAVLLYSITALSFASISIFPG